MTDDVKTRIRRLDDDIDKRRRVIKEKERTLEDYKEALKASEEELKGIIEAQKAGRPVELTAHCKYCFKRFEEGVKDGEVCSTCGLDGY